MAEVQRLTFARQRSENSRSQDGKPVSPVDLALVSGAVVAVGVEAAVVQEVQHRVGVALSEVAAARNQVRVKYREAAGEWLSRQKRQ